MSNYKTFKAGDKVRTIFGKVRTVLFQDGCQVFFAGRCGEYAHPSKCFLIK